MAQPRCPQPVLQAEAQPGLPHSPRSSSGTTSVGRFSWSPRTPSPGQTEGPSSPLWKRRNRRCSIKVPQTLRGATCVLCPAWVEGPGPRAPSATQERPCLRGGSQAGWVAQHTKADLGKWGQKGRFFIVMESVRSIWYTYMRCKHKAFLNFNPSLENQLITSPCDSWLVENVTLTGWGVNSRDTFHQGNASGWRRTAHFLKSPP